MIEEHTSFNSSLHRCPWSTSPALTTYAQVKAATDTGNVICRIDQTQSCGNVMPTSGAMSAGNIATIKLWKTQGFKN